MSLGDLLTHAGAGGAGAAIVALARWLRGREARSAAEARAGAGVEREREATGRHAITTLNGVNDALLARVAALEARLDERDRMAIARDAQHRRELAAAQQERERYQRETIELRGLIASAAEEVNDLKEQLADLRRQLDAERSARTLAEQRAEAAEALARETKGST